MIALCAFKILFFYPKKEAQDLRDKAVVTVPASIWHKGPRIYLNNVRSHQVKIPHGPLEAYMR